MDNILYGVYQGDGKQLALLPKDDAEEFAKSRSQNKRICYVAVGTPPGIVMIYCDGGKFIRSEEGMIKVTRLIQTCSACPTQWEGKTEDGRHIYIRYRWGTLQVGIADTLDNAVQATIQEGIGECHEWTHGDQLDGILSSSELIALTSGVLDFNITSDADYVQLHTEGED